MPAAAELDRSTLLGLRGMALLQGLGDDVLAEVAGCCRFQRVRARQTVMSRADAQSDCCLVLAGRLRVVALSPGGRELSFRDAVTGETLGEIAALDGRPRSATVVALQDSLLARLGAAELRALMERHWPICERMLQQLARTARALTERVYELSTLSVQQRLCAELLRLALAAEEAAARTPPGRREPPAGAGGAQPADGRHRVVLHAPPSHHELAMRISSYREQVTRELADLARQGVVGRVRGRAASSSEAARERGHLVIEDLGRLAARIESAAAA